MIADHLAAAWSLVTDEKAHVVRRDPLPLPSDEPEPVRCASCYHLTDNRTTCDVCGRAL